MEVCLKNVKTSHFQKIIEHNFYVLVFVSECRRGKHITTGINLWHAALILLLIKQLGGANFLDNVVLLFETGLNGVFHRQNVVTKPCCAQVTSPNIHFSVVICSLLLKSVQGVPPQLMWLLSAPPQSSALCCVRTEACACSRTAASARQPSPGSSARSPSPQPWPPPPTVLPRPPPPPMRWSNLRCCPPWRPIRTWPSLSSSCRWDNTTSRWPWLEVRRILLLYYVLKHTVRTGNGQLVKPNIACVTMKCWPSLPNPSHHPSLPLLPFPGHWWHKHSLLYSLLS